MTVCIDEWLVFARAPGQQVRAIQVYHRHYPELRGEGRSADEAARHLARQLARGLEHAHGHGREALEQALATAHARQPPEARPFEPLREGPSDVPRGGTRSRAGDHRSEEPDGLRSVRRGRGASSAQPAGPGGSGR